MISKWTTLLMCLCVFFSLSFHFPDGPQFRQRPQSIEADIGSVVSLTCEVDGNPMPDIVWIQHPIDRVGFRKPFWVHFEFR